MTFVHAHLISRMHSLNDFLARNSTFSLWLAVNMLHEFKLEILKTTLKHLIRILYAMFPLHMDSFLRFRSFLAKATRVPDK